MTVSASKANTQVATTHFIHFIILQSTHKVSLLSENSHAWYRKMYNIHVDNLANLTNVMFAYDLVFYGASGNWLIYINSGIFY